MVEFQADFFSSALCKFRSENKEIGKIQLVGVDGEIEREGNDLQKTYQFMLTGGDD